MLKTRIQLKNLPPSANNIWRHTGKKVYRTSDYMTWLNAAEWDVAAQMRGQPKWSEPVFISAALRKPRSNADVDNRIKPLGDLLQRTKVLENDKLVQGWNVWWSQDLPEGVAAEISIVGAA